MLRLFLPPLVGALIATTVHAQALITAPEKEAALASNPELAAASAKAAESKGPDVVVWQGPTEITLDYLDARMSRIPHDKRAGFMNDPERIEQALRALLLTRSVAQQPESRNLLQDPVVKAEIELATDEILARRRLSLHMSQIEPPDLEMLAKERYLASPKAYSSPESRDLRHILISIAKYGDAEAKRLADQIHAEITAGKLDFVEAARRYDEARGKQDAGSKDEDAGLLEGVAQGDTLSDFDTAAFKLAKIGEVSPVVKTKVGYHIIRLEGRTESIRHPFEAVKAKILQELEQEYMGRARTEFLDRHRSEVLGANPDLVQSLRTRYVPGGPGAQAIERTLGKDSAPVISVTEAEPSAKSAPGAN